MSVVKRELLNAQCRRAGVDITWSALSQGSFTPDAVSCVALRRSALSCVL